MKFERSNQDTCINQKPLVHVGDRFRKGNILADGPSTDSGEIALGKNLLVAFMAWEGYNFEDAIILSDRLVRDDVLLSTSHEIDARDNQTLAPRRSVRTFPQSSEEILADLDEEGIIDPVPCIPGDVLVGKSPRRASRAPPEERARVFGERPGGATPASRSLTERTARSSTSRSSTASTAMSCPPE